MAGEWETKLSRVDAEKDSLRAVVPIPVVKMLGLEDRGSIRWIVEAGPSALTVRVERGAEPHASRPTARKRKDTPPR